MAFIVKKESRRQTVNGSNYSSYRTQCTCLVKPKPCNPKQYRGNNASQRICKVSSHFFGGVPCFCVCPHNFAAETKAAVTCQVTADFAVSVSALYAVCHSVVVFVKFAFCVFVFFHNLIMQPIKQKVNMTKADFRRLLF